MASWLKEKASVIDGIGGSMAAFVAILQLFVVTPMNQRFDAQDRRLDGQDQRLDSSC